MELSDSCPRNEDNLHCSDHIAQIASLVSCLLSILFTKFSSKYSKFMQIFPYASQILLKILSSCRCECFYLISNNCWDPGDPICCVNLPTRDLAQAVDLQTYSGHGWRLVEDYWRVSPVIFSVRIVQYSPKSLQTRGCRPAVSVLN